MIEYERRVGKGPKATNLIGRKCERCGYTQLDSDDDIWAAVGL